MQLWLFLLGCPPSRPLFVDSKVAFWGEDDVSVNISEFESIPLSRTRDYSCTRDVAVGEVEVCDRQLTIECYWSGAEGYWVSQVMLIESIQPMLIESAVI